MGICIVCETESGWRYRWFVVNKDEGIGVGWGGEGGSQYTLWGVERVRKTKRDEQGLKRRRPVKCEMKFVKGAEHEPKQNQVKHWEKGNRFSSWFNF